ncbi:bifunctional adenosylcobinamide kinase/adenosylcobinamide-phosphate guanylyltransferase [Pseudomonadota bacterium]|nr:bifunctional adenosylcobinamide kinase/adenosylcobinamide-phosphate guanylyltransferase [Pseudomonadota bacterium]
MSASLILGGVKSGKSRLAEQLALDSHLTVSYIATARAGDKEMQQRINHHQRSRPSHWQTIEEPLHLAERIQQYNHPKHCVLVDCLTLWLTNLLLLQDDKLLRSEIDVLVNTIKNLDCTLIMVSNETNMGIVPVGELSRRYCDEIGLLHQQLAQQCDTVILTVAGLPHILKGQMHD